MKAKNIEVSEYPGKEVSVVDRILWLIDYCKTHEINGIRFNNHIIEKANLGNSYISDMKSGRVKHPTAEAVGSIANVTGARIRWVLFGEGKPFSDAPAQREELHTEQGRNLHDKITKYLTKYDPEEVDNRVQKLLSVFQDQLRSQLNQCIAQEQQFRSMLQVLEHLLGEDEEV